MYLLASGRLAFNWKAFLLFMLSGEMDDNEKNVFGRCFTCTVSKKYTIRKLYVINTRNWDFISYNLHWAVPLQWTKGAICNASCMTFHWKCGHIEGWVVGNGYETCVTICSSEKYSHTWHMTHPLQHQIWPKCWRLSLASAFNLMQNYY